MDIKPPEKCNMETAKELMYYFLKRNCIEAVEKYRIRIEEILKFNAAYLHN